MKLSADDAWFLAIIRSLSPAQQLRLLEKLREERLKQNS